MRRHNGFAGWYFKHQKGEAMVAFIPGQDTRCGRRNHTIRESCNVRLRTMLTQKEKTVFDLQSAHGVYEFVPEAGHGHKGAF